MHVIKFGGSVLNEADGFLRMAVILEKYKDKDTLIVVSAFSKSSGLLKKAALSAEEGNEIDAKKPLSDFFSYHLELAGKIIPGEKIRKELISVIKNDKDKLFSLIKGIALTKELSPKTYDRLLSYGEKNALQFCSAFLAGFGFDISVIDSTEIIITDSNFRKAEPDYEATKMKAAERLIPAFSRKSMVMTQGFVGTDKNGDITTMGFESSNLTAVLLGNILDAEEITFVTDVAGIRSVDPKLVKKTKLIPEMSYFTAYKCALSGLKLIYPGMISFVSEKGIPVKYVSAFEKDSEHTAITANSESGDPVLICCDSYIYRFDFQKKKEVADFQKKVLQELIIKDLISSYKKSGNSITIFTSENRLKFNYKNKFLNCRKISLINYPDDIHGFLNRIFSSEDIQKPFFIDLDEENSIMNCYCDNKHADRITRKLHELIF